MKHCTKCFEVMPMNNKHFDIRRSTKSGLFSECKGCRKDHRINNIEEYKKRDSNYYKKNKKQRSNYHKQYRIKNRERLRTYNKEYHMNNKDKINVQQRCYYRMNKGKWSTYRRDNRDQYNLNEQRRRTLKRSLISTFTLKQWQQCLTHFNHQCAYCGHNDKLEQDHFIPVSKGGHYTANNIIPACRSCNASKNNKIMQDWFIWREEYSLERMVKILNYIHSFKEYKEA